ncbi:MAG: hypothetical protein C4533_00115 [Candidatus Omnitrophota bacterium]|jgi:hypothetical protein|nr:MAG: hypothetical protein C4533_00115 [Candidatus Omnitrophota bacterium]
MLYLLSVILSISLLLNPASVVAGFFDEKDALIQQSECNNCQSDPLNLNPDLKDKVAAIEKKISSNLNKSNNANEITLFIDLSDSYFDQVVNGLIKFKNDNPGWAVKGVITGRRDSLKQKLLTKQKFFSSGIEFSIDLSGNLAKEFNIIKTPVYLITHNGSQQKLTGLSDFNEFISKLDK